MRIGVKGYWLYLRAKWEIACVDFYLAISTAAGAVYFLQVARWATDKAETHMIRARHLKREFLVFLEDTGLITERQSG